MTLRSNTEQVDYMATQMLSLVGLVKKQIAGTVSAKRSEIEWFFQWLRHDRWRRHKNG